MGKKIIAGLATIPERLHVLPLVIDSLRHQVDLIELSLNGFDAVPKWLDLINNVRSTIMTNEMGDANKFLNIHRHQGCYYFSCDDDLIYPDNYVEKYLKMIQKKNCLITVHGSIIRSKLQSYYKGKVGISHCLHYSKEHIVNIPGSGVSGFDTDVLNIKYERFTERNMADIFLGIQCAEQDIPCVAIEHQKGWLKYALRNEPTIYDLHRNDDRQQTEIVNSFNWPQTHLRSTYGHDLS